MFNRTIIHKTEVTPVTRVIEKSISPDKVTEMYKETLDEVEKQILRSFVFDDNQLKGVVVEYEPLYEQRGRNVAIRFTLNGKECFRKFVTKEPALDEYVAYDYLVGAISDSVTAEVTKHYIPLMKKSL